MPQSGKPDCDVSAYYNYYNGLHVCSHQEHYFIVKNIKMAQFYKLKKGLQTKKRYLHMNEE